MNAAANPRITKKAEKEAAKQAKALALADAVDQASSVLPLPVELGSFGVVKTRFWVFLHERLEHQPGLRRKSLAQLKALTKAMNNLPGQAVEDVARMLESKAFS